MDILEEVKGLIDRLGKTPLAVMLALSIADGVWTRINAREDMRLKEIELAKCRSSEMEAKNDLIVSQTVTIKTLTYHNQTMDTVLKMKDQDYQNLLKSLR